jgi:hypothetical protein
MALVPSGLNNGAYWLAVSETGCFLPGDDVCLLLRSSFAAQ